MKNSDFISCHASTLVQTADGGILCAWFAGSREGADDTAIWYAKRNQDTWSSPEMISSINHIPHWNPVLFKTNNDEILLFYKVGYKISTWSTVVVSSSDNGLSWTKPSELVKSDKGGRGPVKNKPIRLSNGAVLAPASIENGHWDAFVDISEDDGKTWEKSEMVFLDHLTLKDKGVIQPTLWESEPGCVHMLLRSTEGFIYRSDSTNYGRNWCEAYATLLPNNNSGIDLEKLYDGSIVLISNPVGINKGERTPLEICRSYDNGKSWIEHKNIESGKGEFSYPAIISKDKKLFISYTWKRKRIAFIILELEK
jgi:predicted neuraminidase